MDLLNIVFVLLLFVLVLFTYCLENKTIMYFIMILLILLVVQKCVEKNKTERFKDAANNNAKNNANNNAKKNANNNAKNNANNNANNVLTDTTQQADMLLQAGQKEQELKSLQNQVTDLESDLSELREIMRKRSINSAIERNAKIDNFDLAKTQKDQDNTLDKLESELDVLLKIYRKETENHNKDKYSTLPIYSSCKAQEEGMQYLREYENTPPVVQMLEMEESMKNLGIDSKSAAELMYHMKNGKLSDSIDVNLNLD